MFRDFADILISDVNIIFDNYLFSIKIWEVHLVHSKYSKTCPQLALSLRFAYYRNSNFLQFSPFLHFCCSQWNRRIHYSGID